MDGIDEWEASWIPAKPGAEERVREAEMRRALLGEERYWLRINGHLGGTWTEVDKQAYAESEQAAGFYNTLGQSNEPATSAFYAGGVEGTITWGEETP